MLQQDLLMFEGNFAVRRIQDTSYRTLVCTVY